MGDYRWEPGQSLIDLAVGAGILTAEEAQSLRQAETARRVVIDRFQLESRIASLPGRVTTQEFLERREVRPALETVGTAPGVRKVAGLYMMVLQQDMLFFADTTVNIDPDAATLAEIALLASDFVRRLGLVPRVGMLSFSNFGSVRSPQSDKVRKATELVKARAPELEVDGELQADTAVLDDFRRENYPFSTLLAKPNVLIFPNLDAANIAYKLMWRMGGAEAFGPILLGMAHPIHVLQRGSEAADVLNLTALAVVDAQEHAGRHAGA